MQSEISESGLFSVAVDLPSAKAESSPESDGNIVRGSSFIPLRRSLNSGGREADMSEGVALNDEIGRHWAAADHSTPTTAESATSRMIWLISEGSLSLLCSDPSQRTAALVM